jgi:ABC-type glucose/galactose transport system permease subunit
MHSSALSFAFHSNPDKPMQSSLFIIAAVGIAAMLAIFGPRKAPGIVLSIAAVLSAAWLVSAIFTA